MMAMRSQYGRNGLDLDGKIVIKVQLGNDIRKMLIHNDEITYDELVLMMQRIYKGSLGHDDDITIKYKDEDGDLITLFDSTDVSFAIQTCNRQLKLVLFINGLQQFFADDEVQAIRKGLQDVRNSVNTLLDQIDAKFKGRTVDESSDDEEDGQDQIESVSQASFQMQVNAGVKKEFDPLDGGQQECASSQPGYDQSQLAKSFDGASIGERQSVNPSPGSSSAQQSFMVDQQAHPSHQQQAAQPQQPAQQQQAAQQQPSYYGQQQQYNGQPQPSTSATGQQPQLNQQQQAAQQQQPSYGYHQQQAQQRQLGSPYGQPQHYGQQQPQSIQLPQQATQQQPTQQQQQQVPNPQGYPQPGYSQQPQQTQYMGQPPVNPPSGIGNPYTKPGQIRGAYPRAMGNYPNMQQPSQYSQQPPQQ